MNIDERLEFLRQSTESLHATCQELHASVARHAEAQQRLDERERQGRRAIMTAMAAYLKALNGEDSGEKA
jgi:hypothetical protein